MNKWNFWIDRGGTFTDIVAQNEQGQLISHKLLSENPKQYKDAAIEGIKNLMGLERNAAIPSHKIEAVKMGTTVATNALLERQGQATALLITKGFKDALRIGYQARPNIFAKEIILPEQLAEHIIEIDERISADGTILRELSNEAIEAALNKILAKGISSLAIVLMHSWKFPQHEKRIAAIAREMGFSQVSVSHEVSPLAKLVGRGDTTVVDAYLSPILRHYVAQVESQLNARDEGEPNTRLMFMQSSGGLTSANLFQGKDAILSGPAGGVIGAIKTAELAGFDKIIGFDMGGTSTDVSHYQGELERTYDAEIAGTRIRAPMMHVHTVAAGGGSILSYSAGRFFVGPESAGANPGPSCYRNGGPLTVTDANVMVGKLNPKFFPKIFGPEQNQSLDVARVEEKFKALAHESGDSRELAEIADGFLKIAVENMANAIKKISVERGYDVAQYALSCFGGAGGQHACLVADVLGMEAIHLHPFSGILSAYGMGLADIRASRTKSLLINLKNSKKILQDEYEILKAIVAKELNQQGVQKSELKIQSRCQIKYDGTDSALTVNFGDELSMKQDFEKAHHGQFGFLLERPLLIDALEVEAVGGGTKLEEKRLQVTGEAAQYEESSPIFSNGKWVDAKIYFKVNLMPGQSIDGPALIIEEHQTIVVEDEWRAIVNPYNHIAMKRLSKKQQKQALGTKADPILLEVFNNLFMSIAEQMGITLQNTALSVNIKERLDFSCAIFDRQGALVANAPHMPVHLGSMDRSVESIIKANKDTIKPNNVYALNAPYNGGTHLPDITVVTPIFDEKNENILFFVASRGHHADVGGIAPGSMTPLATSVDEEGVLFDNLLLVKEGVFQEELAYKILTDHAYPARNPAQNIADLKAQIAANEKGAHDVKSMIHQYGLETVKAYMGHVQDNAAESVREIIATLKDSSFETAMDTGQKICVSITIDKEAKEATIDFTGTSEMAANNFNAPEPVTRAAVLYAFRVMVEKNIPMNAGCLRPIKIIIPPNSMLRPSYPAAVVAGNVETSQHVTNALFGALGKLSNAQGTMNNLTFGNDTYQYYETICSGSPAGELNSGKLFHGTSGVHTHMTNSRLTDPEILEMRFPVLLEDFHIRKNTGGNGKVQGGDGTKRTLRFLEEMDCSILSSYRKTAPKGLNGGGDGLCGKTEIRRQSGEIEELPPCAQTRLKKGEAITITTPTSGGYGKAKESA